MSSTGRILERVTYSAYGVATRHPVADFNRDGFTDFFDDLAYDDCYTGSGGGCPSGQTADLNLDGFVDQFDYDEWDLSYAEQVNTARGVLSQSDASAAVNRLGYAGYFFEPATQTYLVRNREYDPNVGTWDERDPMGYHDGADLYMYVRDNPVTNTDNSGLLSRRVIPDDNLAPVEPWTPTLPTRVLPRRTWQQCPMDYPGDTSACQQCCESRATNRHERDACALNCSNAVYYPPEWWGDCSNSSSRGNCWRYATGCPTSGPGDVHSDMPNGYDNQACSCAALMAALQSSSSLQSTDSSGAGCNGWVIAVYSEETRHPLLRSCDAHFVRRDFDGGWSDKSGCMPARRPATCTPPNNCRDPGVYDYKFCGYVCRPWSWNCEP
jgi:RHS repeat-associated protein